MYLVVLPPSLGSARLSSDLAQSFGLKARLALYFKKLVLEIFPNTSFFRTFEKDHWHFSDRKNSSFSLNNDPCGPFLAQKLIKMFKIGQKMPNLG